MDNFIFCAVEIAISKVQVVTQEISLEFSLHFCFYGIYF